MARSRVINLMTFGVIAVVLVYTGLLATMWWYQERIVFQPPAGTAPSEVAAKRVQYRATDGVDLFAYVVGECTADGLVLLAFHGNADLARWFVPWAAVVSRDTGACVVIPEYRGYDGINGTPTYAGSALDAVAALGFVRDSMNVSADRVVYFGHSLGTAIAAELAAVSPPRTLVLQSPFSSARAMAARMFVPGLTAFWRIVSRVHFDTSARVRQLRSPVWVAHGDRDIIIPVGMGRDVFAAAAVKGELLIVHGAGHNDVADVGGPAYWNWLARAVHGDRAPEATTPRAAGGRRPAP